MTISIEEARGFIEDAKKSREGWLQLADSSWKELKKANGMKPNRFRSRRSIKYPAWWSIFKIRQPLVLSKVGTPIGRDTTQDGGDNIGATAALLLERLAKNLPKDFDFFDVLSCARDDALATNFGLVRAYYERDEVKQRVREYIEPQQDETGEMFFVNSNGKPVEAEDVYQDDEGYFIYHNQVIDVDNERVCLEHILYKHVYVDPDIKRFNRCKRMAFELYYSVPEFKEVFGAQAYFELPKPEDMRQGHAESAPKRQTIKVYEYWDAYEKEVYWFAENSQDFLKPKAYKPSDDYDEDEIAREQAANGLYDLEKFFPCPTPIVLNASTDEFWPVPEYHQLQEIFEDIHNLFGRMYGLTKAIRARLLFDSNIEGLAAALGEANEADAFGIPNLAQALTGVGGSLDAATQYINVKPLIESLGLVSQSLEQRLMSIYKLTGTSDLLQGQTDNVARTYGEQQMKEKYALNQIEPVQRKMQEFVRDCYQLLCEVALKNFKDESLDVYIMPQTLPEDHQGRYRAALGMLREDAKRFRVELETDSTIALNEEYDKAARAELVNILTTALERVSTIAESSPQLVAINLHAMKYLMQGDRQSKIFQGEFSEAIDKVIKQAEAAAEAAQNTPPFDKDQATIQLKTQEIQATNQLEMMKMQGDQQIKVAQIQSQERIEAIRLQQEAALANMQSQIDTFKVQSDAAMSQQELSVKVEQIRADMAQAQAEIQVKRDALMVEMQKAQGAQGLAEFQAMLDQQAQSFDAQIRMQETALKEKLGMLDEQEKLMTEQRLQSEHQLEQMRTKVEMVTMLKEVTKPAEQPPITINMPAPKKTKKKIKVKRDSDGNMTHLEAEDEEG
jgi:hypothetical protein